MVEGRECLRFALESRQALEVGSERLGQDLDRDLATPRGVSRSLHLSHPAFAD